MIRFVHEARTCSLLLLGFTNICAICESITKVILVYRRKGVHDEKRNFKKIICLALVALTTVLSGSVSANAAIDTGRTYINSTYGYLEGSVTGYYDSFWGEKIFCANAETTVAVPRIRAYMEVMYAKSGITIDTSTSGWEYNSKRTTTFDFEMHHFRNKETGIYDGFVNTKCVAYGTADAITDKAYVVYTCVVE